MLVLTRKLQEKIQIGNQITITVLRVKGNTVRVGIEAPRDVRVVRGELPRFEEAPGELPGSEVPTTDSTASLAPASHEPTPAPTASAGKLPSVGRRFVIQQTIGHHGRPQNTAVAAT